MSSTQSSGASASAPTISGAVGGQTTAPGAAVDPFAGVTIGDANANATDTLTITLSHGGVGGTLSDSGGFSKLGGGTNGVYTLAGSAATITAELDALVFTPPAGQNSSSTTTFTLSDASSAYGATSYGSTPTVLSVLPSSSFPRGVPVLDGSGDVFGVTQDGGANGEGSAFELVKTGASYTQVTLQSFNGAANGSYPIGGLIADANGDLFGTTGYGGASGGGTVFELVKSGSSYTPSTLVSFPNNGLPESALLADANGDLFGTTYGGAGSVFELVKTGSSYALNTLYAFSSIYSYSGPMAGLIADAGGDLFGTTVGYGANSDGSVFELVKNGTSYTMTTLASFNGTNGSAPEAPLVADAAGDLFGTTTQGGANNGTIFELVKSGSSYALTKLASFSSYNGTYTDGLTIDANGDLFGTTYNGGASGGGSVFELVKSGASYASLLTTLASFSASTGDEPVGMSVDASGNLYVTAFMKGVTASGAVGGGAVLELPLVFTPTATVDSTTTVAVQPAVAPTISGTVAAQATTSEAPVDPFAGVTIGDANPNATDTLTITLSNGGAGGTLADGVGFSKLGGGANGVYTLTGSAATVTSELDALVFPPVAGAPNTSATTTFTLSDTSSAYATATVDSTASVIDADPAVAPTISGTVGGQATTSEAPVDPFAGVTIGDANANASDTLTITLSNGGAGGTLSDGVGFSKLGGGANGVYTLTGSPETVTSELDALVFTPVAGAPNTSATTTFTLSDTSSAYATATVDSTASVIDADPAVAPSLSGTAGGQVTTSEARVNPFVGVTVGDANANATDTLTITLSNGGAGGTLTDPGVFNNLGGGANGVYTLTGSPETVTNVLDGLVFTPNAGQPNTSATTTFTLSDTSSAYAAATTDSTTTVTDVDPALPPTISGTVGGQTTGVASTIAPFANARIADSVAGAIDTVTITLSNAGAGGALSGAGLAGGTGGVYTLAGSAATVTSELDGLVFTPAAGSANTTTTFTLAAVSSAEPTALSSTPTVLAAFGGPDGSYPQGLASDAAGDLFGVTNSGGSGGAGTVFELVKTASGYGAPQTLATFATDAGGANPKAVTLDASGDLFVTLNSGSGASADGQVVELVNTPSGYGAPQTLATFTGPNGADPVAGVTFDAAGDLFGTTTGDWVNNHGTVFEMPKSDTGFGALVTLASFNSYNSKPIGSDPFGDLAVDASGNLFGTASSDGLGGDGTVFELAKTGSGYAAPVAIASFGYFTGQFPVGNLDIDAAGDLFGTTSDTVFEIVKSASGYSAPVSLATFTYGNGLKPGGLMLDASGNLFGTAMYGGDGGAGTVFEIPKTAGGYGAMVTLTGFNSATGLYPAGTLLSDSSGDLFGATGAGGAGGSGTVFELARAATPSVDATTTVNIIAYAPTISGAAGGQTTAAEATVTPFAAVAIGDANANATDTLTITLSNGGAGGTLSDGVGFSKLGGGTNGVYTLAGSAATVTSELEALVFTPTRGQPNASVTTTFTLSDVSSALPTPTVDSTTSVTDVAAAVAPTLSGATGGLVTTSEAAVHPFAAVAVADPNANASDTLTITLSNGGMGGTLSGNGLAGGTNGVYTVSGAAAAITSELEALAFTPTAGQPNTSTTTTFTLSDVSTAYATPTPDATTTVTNADPAVAPVLSGALAGQKTTPNTAFAPFAQVTVGDANANATDTLVIVESNGGVGGALSGTGLGAGAGGVYALSGAAATLTSELDALIFTPAAGQIGATTTFSLIDVSSLYAAPTVDATTTVSVIPAVAPTLSGATGGQTTTSEAAVDPFATVVIGDANPHATDTLTIALSNGGAGGMLSGTGLSGGAGGVYTLAGAAATVTGELRALAFTPVAGQADTTAVTTFTLSDTSSAYGAATVDSTTSVTNVDPAVAPTLSGATAGQATTSETAVLPFANVTDSDANANATDTLAITLSNGGAGGTLSGNGLSGGTNGVYTLPSGSAATVTSELDALVFTPVAGAPNTSATTTFTLSDTSSAYATATVDSTTSVIDADPAVASTLSGAIGGQSTTSEATVKPFASVTIGDANANATETLSITLSNGGAGGTLAGAGLVAGAGGVYALSGSAATVTSELDALTFTPAAGAPNTSATTTFTLSDTNSAYAAATVDSTTTVTNVDPAVAPTISGVQHGLTTTSAAPIGPFAHVVIGDANASATETLSITLSNGGAGGTLAGVGLIGGAGGGVYTLSGSAATVTSELDALTFYPAPRSTTTFTLSDTSSAFATPATNANASVTDVTAPAIVAASYVGSGSSGHWSLSGAADAGDTVTIYDGAHRLGSTVASGGVWTFAGGNNTAVRDFTVTATVAAGNTSAPSSAWYEGTPGNDTFSFASQAALAAAAVINGGAGVNTVQLTAGAALTDADFSALHSIEALALSGASSVALGSNAAAAGISAVTLLAGAAGPTSIADSNAGTLAVNAAGLGAGDTLQVSGSTAEAIANLAGNLNASAAGGTLSVAAVGATQQTIATGSGAITVTDNAAGGSLAIDATALLASNSVRLYGSAAATVTNLSGALGAANSSGPLTVTAVGTTAQSVTTGSGKASITDKGARGMNVNAAKMAAGSTLTLAGSANETVSNLAAGLDASAASGTVTVAAVGATQQTIATGSGAITVTDNAAGGSLAIDATALLASNSVRLFGSAAATVTNLSGTLGAANSSGALRVIATGTTAQSMTAGSGNASITDNGAGGMNVNAAQMAAGSTLTLAGSAEETVTNLAANVVATGLSGALNVTTTGLAAHTIATGSGNDSITATHGGDTILAGSGADTINVAGHAIADTFTYSAVSDSINTAGGHDAITGFAAGGSIHDLFNFSPLDPNLNVQGGLSGANATVSADSIAWLYNGAGAMIYVNDTVNTLATGSASLMAISLKGTTSGLTSQNFKV